MAQILSFRLSNGFTSAKALFATVDSLESCNSLIEATHQLYAKNCISIIEYEKLKEIGRAKRLELARPLPNEPVAVEGPGLCTYTPEMGDSKPICQIEAQLAYYGKHYYLDTPLDLNGRGIRFQKRYKASDFTDANDRRVGWNQYYVTKRAFEKLKETYSVSMETYLD